MVDSGVEVDSYQSSLGAYGPANNGVDGDVQAAMSITINSGGVVHGSLYPNDPAGLTPVPTPSSYTNLGDLNIQSDYTFKAGDYLVDTLNVNGTPVISVEGGPVRIWFNSLNLAGTIGAGASEPSQLVFFSRVGAGQVNINGTTAGFTGVIYAPNITVILAGRGSFNGACVGSQLLLDSAPAVHYDEDLGQGCRAVVKRAAMKLVGPGKTTTDVQQGPFRALAVVPNPAHGEVTVAYDLLEPALYTLRLMDIRGGLVAVKALGMRPAGAGQVRWDMEGYAPGVYWIEGEANEGGGVKHRSIFKLALLGR